MRYHVAAWAVGDHDGNPSNVLRTPSGGLCPVDQGQSFKFYGSDRPATDYHPNSVAADGHFDGGTEGLYLDGSVGANGSLTYRLTGTISLAN